MRIALASVVVAATLSLLPGACPAELLRLTIDEAVTRGLKANLDLQANRKDIDVAQATLERAGSWMQTNPFLSLGASSRPDSSGRRNVFVYLSQEFEVAGQHGPRQDAARYGLDREAANVRQAETSMAASIKSAFVRALINGERVRVAQQNLDLAEESLKANEADQPHGLSERIDLNNARMQALRARRELAGAEQARDDTMDTLRRVLDIAFDDDIEPVGTAQTSVIPAPALVELVDRAKRQRADLIAFERAVKSTNAQLDVARRDRIPNVTIAGSFSHYDTGDYAGGDVGVPLPVFQTKEAEVMEAAAEHDRATLQLQDMQREVEREVREARRGYDVAAKDLEVYRTTILPLAEDNVRLQRRMLDRDEASDSDLINQQIESLGTRRDYLEVLERFNIALIDLERAIGGPLAEPAPAPR